MKETILFPFHQRPLSPLFLEIVEGEKKGERFPIVPGRQSFGRASDNAIVLDDAAVSHRHGIVEYTDRTCVTVFDSASRNGISVNGRKAPVLKLKVGKLIQIGSIYLRLSSQSERTGHRIRFFATALLAALVLAAGVVWSRREIPTTTRPTVVRTYPQRTIAALKAREWEQRGEEAFDARKYGEARAAWKRALAADPKSKTAKEGVARLDSLAGRFLEDAVMLKGKSPDAARERLTAILAMTPPSSPLHREARRMLKGKR